MIDSLSIAKWRFFLLRKQKLGLVAFIAGIVASMVSFAVASSSYLYPQKIYWDFVLGLSFVVIVFLAVLISSMLLGDEKQRRTLHLILASGVSRRAWVWGNFLGIASASVFLLILWSLCAGALSILFGAPTLNLTLVLQSQLVLVFELFIVAAMSFSFSFFLRPLLALLLSMALIIFLHSQVSLLAVLGDAQTGAFNTPVLQPLLQYLVPILPPLEWYDLRVLVGYQGAFEWTKVVSLAAMAVAWTVFWIELGLLKFNRADL